MAANKQDPRFFKYSPFPKRQCAVTGIVGVNGEANFLSASSNTIVLNATSTDPLVVTWANGFDPFPVDYAYKWTSTINGPSGWTGFSNATHYLYIDYDPATETVSYGSTTVLPNDDKVAPSHGAGVHWFDTSKYKMYESVSSAWVERIRVFVGECASNGTLVSSFISYAFNGRYMSEEVSIPAVGTPTTKNHYIGSNKLTAYKKIINKTADVNASPGDIYDVFENRQPGASATNPRSIVRHTRLTISSVVGSQNSFVDTNTGDSTVITPANWRLLYFAERRY